MLSRVVIFACFALILGVPLAMRIASPVPKPPAGARTLVVITPHVPQIRTEFGEAFSAWHQRKFGEAAHVDWRAPGTGTSELLKVLEAQFIAAAKQGAFEFHEGKDPTARPGAIAFDAMFGGGSYDHGRLKKGVKVVVAGTERTIPMSAPAGFSDAELAGWFGTRSDGKVNNAIGAGNLYDPQQYWIGTALSSFGIVYSKDALARLHLDVPRSFDDLADPRLAGELILADPRQSGSISTAIDAILNASLWNRAEQEGWRDALNAAFDKERATKAPWEQSLSTEQMASVQRAFEHAWRLLREVTANARTYTAAATRPPMDISAGEGAAGLSIDFYGRGQAQALVPPGADPLTSRVGYIDPVGATYVDADPISILRGGPDPELAKRFVEFCLTDEAQALWQLPAARSAKSSDNPKDASGRTLGPRLYELRRLPVKRAMYDPKGPFRAHFVDNVDPFEIAAAHKPAGWRDAIGIMFGAFSIDNAHAQREAWRAIRAARANADFPPDTLREMEQAFYAFPPTPTPEGTLKWNASNFRAIKAEYAKAQVRAPLEIAYTTFFREQYARVLELSSTAGANRN